MSKRAEGIIEPATAAPDPYRLRAMEVWGGSGPAEHRVTVPGFEGWVYCRPHNPTANGSRGARSAQALNGDASAGQRRRPTGGGDFRFISTCAAGQIVRLMLADISGHGADAEVMARRLRTIVRKHINKPNPTRFARALNWELSRLAEEGSFATAVITTYFAPTDHLIICNAGHPRPLLHRARLKRWELLDESAASVLPSERIGETGVRNLPLGVVGGADYHMFATRLEPGDLVVLYTDALIEAADEAGNHLGEQGLLEAAAEIDVLDSSLVGPELLAIGARHRAGPCEDDETVIVLSHTATDPPSGPVARLKSLGRLVGLRMPE